MLRLRSAVCSIALVSGLAWTFVPPAAAMARAEQPKSCALVTAAELEPITGYPLDAGDEIVASAKALGCLYKSSDRASGAEVGLLLTTTANGNAKKLFGVKAFEQSLGKSKQVSGLGTRANFAFKKGKNARAGLLVVDGNKGVQVLLADVITRDDALADAQTIATLVLTKLV